MKNALRDWLRFEEDNLKRAGIAVSFSEGKQPGSYSANIDSATSVGTVCYWPNGTFEFQFNDCKSGNVVVLETLSFDDPTSLETYLNELVYGKLKPPSG